MIVDCLLHAHSDYSYDSPTPLADIARTARQQGISCVLMSEHNNTLDEATVVRFAAECDSLSSPEFLMIPGLELAYADNRLHLLAYGVRHYIDSTGAGATFEDLVERVHQLGGIAVLAHPSHKSAFQLLSAEQLGPLDGMEVWNTRNGNRFFPDGTELGWLSGLRGTGLALKAFGGVDLHHLARFVRLVARIEVSRLTAGDVLAELSAGRFEVVGPLVHVGSDGHCPFVRRQSFRTLGAALKHTRRLAYRCQAWIERTGFRVPRPIAALWRRVF